MLLIKLIIFHVTILYVTGRGRGGREFTGNSCSPKCTSCEPKNLMATGQWCLLECNNPGAPRCLEALCDCW